MADLPSGTVTFLFTDVEGSTRLWERHPEAMKWVLARHDAILRAAVESHGGHVVKTTGDGVHAVFGLASDAVDAAVDAQLGLGAESWDAVGVLSVRMGLHSGAADVRAGDYFGPALNRAARLMAAGHGGQILCSQATADLVRDALAGDVDLLDLGAHVLRDLSRPEEVFQVTRPGFVVDFPPLRTVEAARGNLPSVRTDFIGRDEELARLIKLLDRSAVVTLTGVGGVGKTRLALEAAASSRQRFDDGVWFVDLGPVDDASLVPAVVASALRLPDRRLGSAEEAIVASMRDARALIILDNCEHVIGATASLAELVTDRCPEVSVVATSREPLGIEGERVFGVGPLALPDTGGALVREEILNSDAVRLFVERANAAREAFELTDDNAGAVAAVCRRLDGIPLALELAAARVQSLSPQSILERLGERFRLLSQGRRTALARHQTLRAAVDWSFDLLDGAEQLTFARLSVFAGGFTLEASEAVVADDDTDSLDVLDRLSGLVSKSMVVLDDDDATLRYRLLETMREYAADRLDQLDQPARVRGRHAEYYLQFAEQAAPHIVGADDGTWTRRLEDEHDNLHVTLSWARDHEPPKLTRLAKALGPFWRHQRHFREGLGWTTAALDRDPNMSLQVRAKLAAQGGLLATQMSLIEQGHTLLQQSLSCSAQAGEEPIADALGAFALDALVANRPVEARRYAEQALTRASADHDPYQEADFLVYASAMFAMTGDDPRGWEFADRAIEQARPLGNHFLLATALLAGGMARYRVDPEAAVALLDECIIVSTDANSEIPTEAFFFKGIAHLTLRQYGAAAEALDTALARHHAAGAEYYQSTALAAVAALLARLGSVSSAVRILGALARLREEGQMLGAPRDLAMQDQLADRLRQTTDPKEFAAWWADGRQLQSDDAVRLAQEALAQVPK